MSTPEITFYYSDPSEAHRNAYREFKDADAPDFVDSQLFKDLSVTEFVQLNEEWDEVIGKKTCNLDANGQVFQLLEADYNYLIRWFHNEHRKANTRHGTYIMLYLTENGYAWKLSDWFFTRLLTIPDNLNDLFDFG